MKIIRRRKDHETVSYQLGFTYLDLPGAGASFACDEHGRVDEVELATRPVAYANYQDCLRGVLQGRPVRAQGVQRFEHRWVEPAVGRCNVCSAEVELAGFTNTCNRCNTDYNGAGQQLAPRCCWGEETGETASDILLGGESDW